MASPSPGPRKKAKKGEPAREFDVSNARTGVWLVKVPNYLADAWKDAEPDADLGKMMISRSGSKLGEMKFTLSEILAVKAGAKLAQKAAADGGSKVDSLELPREHRVHTQDTSKQSLNAFSEAVNSGYLEAEGRVTKRADMQPADSAAYMKLKKYQIKEAGKTKFKTEWLDTTPFRRPAKDTKVPKQLDKRARDDREMVLDLIFTSFQSHEFYAFKDLVYKTNQPPAYLKDILKEVCIYNTRQPHKNMWRLKPEYRHYQKTD